MEFYPVSNGQYSFVFLKENVGLSAGVCTAPICWYVCSALGRPRIDFD